MKQFGTLSFVALFVFFVTACKISYTPNGASIDYTKVKTITIKDFPNQAFGEQQWRFGIGRGNNRVRFGCDGSSRGCVVFPNQTDGNGEGPLYESDKCGGGF